jgi:hypothetical protein
MAFPFALAIAAAFVGGCIKSPTTGGGPPYGDGGPPYGDGGSPYGDGGSPNSDGGGDMALPVVCTNPPTNLPICGTIVDNSGHSTNCSGIAGDIYWCFNICGTMQYSCASSPDCCVQSCSAYTTQICASTGNYDGEQVPCDKGLPASNGSPPPCLANSTLCGNGCFGSKVNCCGFSSVCGIDTVCASISSGSAGGYCCSSLSNLPPLPTSAQACAPGCGCTAGIANPVAPATGCTTTKLCGGASGVVYCTASATTGATCCAEVGHAEISCPSGSLCTRDGQCLPFRCTGTGSFACLEEKYACAGISTQCLGAGCDNSPGAIDQQCCPGFECVYNHCCIAGGSPILCRGSSDCCSGECLNGRCTSGTPPPPTASPGCTYAAPIYNFQQTNYQCPPLMGAACGNYACSTVPCCAAEGYPQFSCGDLSGEGHGLGYCTRDGRCTASPDCANATSGGTPACAPGCTCTDADYNEPIVSTNTCAAGLQLCYDNASGVENCFDPSTHACCKDAGFPDRSCPIGSYCTQWGTCSATLACACAEGGAIPNQTSCPSSVTFGTPARCGGGSFCDYPNAPLPQTCCAAQGHPELHCQPPNPYCTTDGHCVSTPSCQQAPPDLGTPADLAGPTPDLACLPDGAPCSSTTRCCATCLGTVCGTLGP